MKTITKAYKFEIDPTPAQAQQMLSHIGASRKTYNTLLSHVLENWTTIRLEKENGGQKTPYVSTGHWSLLKLWNQKLRTQYAPWWEENSSHAYNDGAKRLATALSNYYKGQGRLPKYKKREQGGSYRTAAPHAYLADRHHVFLPKVGQVKTYETTRKLARHLERGTGKVIAVTAKLESGRWFVIFTTEIQQKDLKPRDTKNPRIVGVDVGLSTLYTMATPDGKLAGEVQNPRTYKKLEKQLGKRQRQTSRKQGPAHGVAPSKRWLRANKRVQQMHYRIKNQRKNLIHNTTTRLCKSFDVIIIEDLNISSMLHNRKLAKHISQASWGEFARQLDYKSEWYGVKLVRADRWFASSKTCSGCGFVKAKLSLSERVFECEKCGLKLDRDLNAALNLARLGDLNQTGTSSGIGRGGDDKTKTATAVEARSCETSTKPSLVRE